MALHFSFFEKEILVPGTAINLTLPRAVDLATVKSAISFLQGKSAVEVPISINGTIIDISTHHLKSDLYTIHVDRIFDSAGFPVTNHRESRSVCIRRFPGNIPRNLRLEHVVHLAIGDLQTQRLLPGEKAPKGANFITRIKAVDSFTHIPTLLSFDENGHLVDGVKLVDEVLKRRFEKFGRIDEALWHQCEECEVEKLFEVMVWPLFEYDHSKHRDSHDHSEKPSHEAKIKVQDAFRTPKNALMDHVSSLGGEIEDLVPGLPSFLARLKKHQIHELSKSSHLAKIFPYSPTAILDRSGVTKGNLSSSFKISRADEAIRLGFTGKGVKVAVWEKGPQRTAGLQFESDGRYDPNPGEISSTDSGILDHSRMTSAIIKNVDTTVAVNLQGYAHDCLLYSANQQTKAALFWACQTHQCTVVSVSFHTTDDMVATMSHDDVVQDYYALTYPFTTFVNAAGEPHPAALPPDTPAPPETLSADYVCHKGYNVLTVGYHGTNLLKAGPNGAVVLESNFLNPTSTNGDRELPHLVAPGKFICVLQMVHSGSSFAAPAVAGTVAMIQAVQPSLPNRPEACRAIIMAAAGRNASGSTWYADVTATSPKVDGRDGAGVLDTLASCRIAQNYNNIPNLPGKSSGWAAGKFLGEHFAPGTGLLKEWKWLVTFPSTIPAPPVPDPANPTTPVADQSLNLKVVLCWNSKIAYKPSGATHTYQNVDVSTLTVNLDLLLFDEGSGTGQQVAVSATMDNSYEVIDFKPVLGGRYSINVRLVGTGLADPAEGTFFGIAWGSFCGGVLC